MSACDIISNLCTVISDSYVIWVWYCIMDEVVVVHKSSFQKRSHFLHGQKPCWSWRPRPGGNIFFPFLLACNFLKDDGSHRKTDQRWWTAFAWFSTAFFPNVIFFSVCVLSKLSTTLLIMWRLQISKCSRADKKERTAFPSQSQVLQHYLQLASPFSTQPWWHFSQSKVMKCNQSGGPYSFSSPLLLLPIKLFELGNQVMQ